MAVAAAASALRLAPWQHRLLRSLLFWVPTKPGLLLLLLQQLIFSCLAECCSGLGAAAAGQLC
jgi:hypothetical protein